MSFNTKYTSSILPKKFLKIFLFILLFSQYSYSFAEIKPILTIEFGGAKGRSLLVDSQDSIHVFDTSYKFRKFTKDGVLLKVWGGKGFGDGYFHKPTRVGLDSYDRIYVEDYIDDSYLNKRIKIFSVDGIFLGDHSGSWPFFDKKNNSYNLIFESKFDDIDSGQFNYALQKVDINSDIVKEWKLTSFWSRYYSNYFIPDWSFDSSGNAYYIDYMNFSIPVGNYNPIFKIKKLNISSDQAISSKSSFSSLDNLGIDNRSYIYAASSNPQYDYGSYGFSSSILMLDKELETIGRLYANNVKDFGFDRSSSIYILLNSKIEIYSALPTLKAPRLVSAKRLSSTKIKLVWQDRTKNETGFNIQRAEAKTDGQCSNSLNFRTVKITKANVNSTELALPAVPASGKKYLCYRMTALRGNDESLSSGELGIDLKSGYVVVND